MDIGAVLLTAAIRTFISHYDTLRTCETLRNTEAEIDRCLSQHESILRNGPITRYEPEPLQ